MMRTTNSIPGYFPVPPIIFPVRAEKFPFPPPREFAHNRLILFGISSDGTVGLKKFPVIFPSNGKSRLPGVPAEREMPSPVQAPIMRASDAHPRELR